MKKFLLAVQYWEGDKESAEGLLELLAETVEPKNKWADLCVYARFDAKFPDESLFKKLAPSFNKVWVLRSRTQMTGWPDGCNALWSDLVMDAYRLSTESAIGSPQWAEYKSVLAIESDTCPLRDSWLEDISKEWDSNDVVFMGAWDERNGDHPHLHGIGHINGNAMFAINLAKRVPSVMGTPYKRGWDTHHAPALRDAGWQGTHLMRNHYRFKTLTVDMYNQLLNEGAVMLHGIKDESVRNLYRKNRLK